MACRHQVHRPNGRCQSKSARGHSHGASATRTTPTCGASTPPRRSRSFGRRYRRCYATPSTHIIPTTPGCGARCSNRALARAVLRTWRAKPGWRRVARYCRSRACGDAAAVGACRCRCELREFVGVLVVAQKPEAAKKAETAYRHTRGFGDWGFLFEGGRRGVTLQFAHQRLHQAAPQHG